MIDIENLDCYHRSCIPYTNISCCRSYSNQHSYPFAYWREGPPGSSKWITNLRQHWTKVQTSYSLREAGIQEHELVALSWHSPP